MLKREQRKEQTALTEDMIRKVASNGTEIIDTIIKTRTYKSKDC